MPSKWVVDLVRLASAVSDVNQPGVVNMERARSQDVAVWLLCLDYHEVRRPALQATRGTQRYFGAVSSLVIGEQQ